MEKENVVVNAEGKKAIILTSEGDLRHMPHPFKTTAHQKSLSIRWTLSDQIFCRKAITSLQSCARLKGDVEVKWPSRKPQSNMLYRWGRRMCMRYLG